MGKRYGSYEIIDRLGDGPHGAVHLAVDAVRDRMVALKLLRTLDPVARTDRTNAFQEAFNGLAAVRTPTVGTLYTCSAAGEVPVYVAREYVNGITLHALRHHSRRLARPFAVAVLHSVALALAATHAVRKTHGNLKLTNVLIQQVGGVKVVDPAIVGPLIARTPAEVNFGSGLFGAPVFLAPEQMASGQAREESDVYSLGVLAYLLLCGQYPFDEPDVGRLRRRKVTGDYPDPRDVVSDLPEPLAAIVRQCLERLPQQRTVRAEAVALRLAEWLAASGTTSEKAIAEGVQAASFAFLMASVGTPAVADSAPSVAQAVESTPPPLPLTLAEEDVPPPRAGIEVEVLPYLDAIAPALVAPTPTADRPAVWMAPTPPPGPPAALDASTPRLGRAPEAYQRIRVLTPPPDPSPIVDLAPPLGTDMPSPAPFEVPEDDEPPPPPRPPLATPEPPRPMVAGTLEPPRRPAPALFLAPDAVVNVAPPAKAPPAAASLNVWMLLAAGLAGAALVFVLVRPSGDVPSSIGAPSATPGLPSEAPKDPTALLDDAQKAADGPPEKALETARLAAEALPGNARAQLLVGHALYRTGAYEDALTALRQAGKLAPNDVEPKRLSVKVLLAQGLNRPAADTARAALDTNGADAELYVLLGRAELADRRLDAAAETLATATRVAPDRADAWLLLGETRQKQGKLAEARDAFRRAVEQRPKDAAGYVGLGKVLLLLGRGGDAADTLARGLEVAPEAAELHYTVGRILLHDGRLPEAIRSLEAFTQKWPAEWRGHFSLGLAALRSGDAAAAATALEVATRLRPNQAELHFDRGLALARSGDDTAAVAAFGEAIKLRYALWEAHCERAKAQQRLAQYEVARRGFEETVKLNPDCAAARSMLEAPPASTLAAMLLGLPCAARGDLDVGD